MGTHRMYMQSLPAIGEIALIEGDEAKHAVRVKRVEPGDPIQLLDGAGAVVDAVVLGVESLTEAQAARRERRGEWLLPVRVEQIARAEPVRPAVHVLTATPKGARLEEMIDGLSQVGAASWGPLETQRGVVDPRETKLARMERVAVEASKQCGRPWLLQTGPQRRLADALAWKAGPVILADSSGGPYSCGGAEQISLLIGPEGGWTRGELQAAEQAGARIHSFGPHVMRIETAAVVASGIILAAEHAAT